VSQAEWQACKRDIVDRFATPSNLRGSLQFLSVVVPIAALWFVIRQTWLDSPWLDAAATAALSLFLLRGFVLMHDCGHHSLFRSKSLNRLGGFLLGVLSGLPQQVWAENHRYHHVTNGNWARYRGPLNVASVADYQAMSVRGRRHYRYTRDILVAPLAGCLYFLVNPRITWLRASIQRLRRGSGTQAASPPPAVSAAHYRHMLWNNLLLLAAWGAMAWAVGPLQFLVCYLVSGSLAGAYGIAVSALMIITTVLAALIARQWGYNIFAVIAVNGCFFIVDAVFFSANSLKLLEGGWFPLLLAALIAFVMLTWRRGEQIVEKMRIDLRHPEEEMRRKIADPNLIRLPGAAVFLTSAKTGMPLAMANFLRHNHALHKRILLVTVQSSEQPRIKDDMRTEVTELGFGVSRVVISYGFTEQPDVPHAIKKALERGLLDGFEPRALSYIIGSETIIPSEHSRAMSHWREILFAFVQHNSERSAVWFKVPPKQAVEFGTEIEI